MKDRADSIADCVLKVFDQLASKAKPRTYPDGAQEWVPLSGIVLGIPCDSGISGSESIELGDKRLQLICVALGLVISTVPGAIPQNALVELGVGFID